MHSETIFSCIHWFLRSLMTKKRYCFYFNKGQWFFICFLIRCKFLPYHFRIRGVVVLITSNHKKKSMLFRRNWSKYFSHCLFNSTVNQNQNLLNKSEFQFCFYYNFYDILREMDTNKSSLSHEPQEFSLGTQETPKEVSEETAAMEHFFIGRSRQVMFI